MNLHNEIAVAAYELYEKNGRIGGNDVENWLEAEKIIKARKMNEGQATLSKKVERVKGAGEPLVEVVVQETTEGLKTLVKGLKKDKSKDSHINR